tara:strand:- start:274 stop:597 length:324 start_codon:yes stop_codon:yes gene_type:complete
VNRLRWLITVPIAIIVVVFAVNNRGPANVDLWPFDLVIAWPMFVYVFIGAGIGFVVGATLSWISGSAGRKTSRERMARIRELERASQQAETPTPTQAPAPQPPVPLD